MATQYAFGQIVTSGLVLSLNAADKNSYPGSGTTWTDMSGNGNTGTLFNSPTFNSANGGAIVFDGVDDYCETTVRNVNLEFQPTQPYSAFVWFKGPSAQESAIIANMNLTALPYPGWDLWFNNATVPNSIAMHLISSWSSSAIKVNVDYDYASNLNKWIYFGYTYDGSSPTTALASLSSVNFYFNGALYTSGKAMGSSTDGFNTSSETITYNSSQRFRVASRWVSGTVSSPAQVTVPIVQVYNRVLSAAEILQNYTAQKSRYGL